MICAETQRAAVTWRTNDAANAAICEDPMNREGGNSRPCSSSVRGQFISSANAIREKGVSWWVSGRRWLEKRLGWLVWRGTKVVSLSSQRGACGKCMWVGWIGSF